MTTTVESLLQIALENKQAMDEAMRLADGAHRAKRQFASVPAAPSAFGSLGDLAERSGEGVQAPGGTCERCGASREGACRAAQANPAAILECPRQLAMDELLAPGGKTDYVRWSEQDLDPALVDPIDPKEWR